MSVIATFRQQAHCFQVVDHVDNRCGWVQSLCHYEAREDDEASLLDSMDEKELSAKSQRALREFGPARTAFALSLPDGRQSPADAIASKP